MENIKAGVEEIENNKNFIFSQYLEKIGELKGKDGNILGGIFNYIEGTYFNMSLFGKEEKKLSKSDISVVIDGFHNKIEGLKSIKREILSYNHSNLPEYSKKYLLNTLNDLMMKYKMLIYSTQLEAHKAGFPIEKSIINNLNNTVNTIQNFIFGKQISQSPQELDHIISSLGEIFENKKTLLTLDEEETFEKFLLQYPKILLKTKQPPESSISIPSKDNKQITTYQLKEIFDKIYAISGIPGKAVLNKNISNIEVKKYDINIPDNESTRYSMKRVCELIDHELSVHVYRAVNRDKTLKVNSPESTEFEEGFAKISEQMASKKFEDVDDKITIHDVSTLFGELFNFNHTKKLLSIYYKMTTSRDQLKCETMAEERTKRVKRYYDFNLPGSNRKDTSYSRGLKSVVELLSGRDINQQEAIKSFYFSKISLHEIPYIEELRKELNIDESELQYPLWIGKVLFKKLSGESLIGIENQDFRFKNYPKTSFIQKRMAIELIQTLKNL